MSFSLAIVRRTSFKTSQVLFPLFIVFHNCDSGVRWAYGLYWYPFILIAPGLTLSLNWLAGRMDSSSLSIVVKAIGWVGKYSFEVYLIQELVKFFVSWLIQTGQAKESNLMWTILFLMVLVVAPLLKLCGDLLRRAVCE